MKISVVIPTYRRADSLKRTLLTIAAQRRRPEEVIVVDQSPPSERAGVEAAIAEARSEGLDVRAIWADTPSSTRARNLGFASSTGDWVIFSDDDVDWPREVTGIFADKLAATPELVMLAARDTLTSSRAKPAWRRFASALFLTDTLSPIRRGIVLPCMQARYPQPVIGDMETEWAMGYWFAVDRVFVSSHGLMFDEKMIRYAQAEDMLFSHQVYHAAQKSARRCVVSEDVAVAHRVSQEWREADSFADLCDAWNRIYIAGQLRPGWRFLPALAAICVAALHKAIVRVLRRRSWAGPLRAHLLALANLGDIRAGRFARLYEKYEGTRR